MDTEDTKAVTTPVPTGEFEPTSADDDQVSPAKVNLPSNQVSASTGVSERSQRARRNGRRSRGPKTKRGKAISRLNAIKHGLFTKLAFSDLDHVRGFDLAKELLADLMRAYPPKTLAESLRLQKVACDLWREARATQLEVSTTEKPNAFCNDWLSRLVNYANAVHKGAENSLATLDKLDEQTRESQPSNAARLDGHKPAPGEVASNSECSSRKPVGNNGVSTLSHPSVA